jgi:uncharacterized membrane protein YciS (DUF1049 family)
LEGIGLKIQWKKLLGLVVVDVFVIAFVREFAFRDDFTIFRFMLESIQYNLSHFSIVGLVGAFGMTVLFIFICGLVIKFIHFNWTQLKSSFSKK